MSDQKHENPCRTTRAFGHVASGVGHHVINGFAAIVTNAEIYRIALNGRTTIDREALAVSIIRTALEASAVARRMIDYSRLHTDPGDVDVDLAELVVKFVSCRSPDLEDRVDWLIETRPVPRFPGNPEHLEEMLELLVQNSLESVDAGSRVTISITIGLDDRGWIVMELADDGRGMEPGTAEHAIEPFFTTKPNRFGVGLTIANGIWRRHSGTLSLRSSVDEGTTIRLCIDPQPNPGLLPVDRRAIPVLVESTPPPPASEPSRSSG